MNRVMVGFFISVLMCAQAFAGSLDVGLNDDSAEVNFRQVISEDTLGSSEFNLKGVYASEDEDIVILGVGIDVYGELIEGLRLGIGARVYGIDVENLNEEAVTLSLGGAVKFAPAFMRGFGFYGGIYYSPEIFSWADAEHLVDIDAGVQYQLIPRAGVFAGYNKTRVEYENIGRVTVDEGVRGGMYFKF